MVINKKVTGNAMNMPVAMGIGLACSMIITIVGTVITAYLVLSEKIGENAIGYSAIVILLLASAAGAWLTAGLIKRRWMVICVGAGGIYYLTLLAITALFFGGQYQGMGVTALVVLGGCGAVGLLGLNRGRSRRNITNKRRFR